MNKSAGFTLIEIMVALAIFAILATITTSVLVRTVHISERVTQHATQKQAIELAVARLQQDIFELIPRAVRGNEMHLFPPIIAQHHYVEFTRAGITNPIAAEQRSTLARIAYICENGQLIHRVWQVLDTPNRNDYHDVVLLTELKTCSFEYLGMHNLWVSNWYQEMPQDKKQDMLFFPKALQIELGFNKNSSIKLYFPITQGLYD